MNVILIKGQGVSEFCRRADFVKGANIYTFESDWDNYKWGVKVALIDEDAVVAKFDTEEEAKEYYKYIIDQLRGIK